MTSMPTLTERPYLHVCLCCLQAKASAADDKGSEEEVEEQPAMLLMIMMSRSLAPWVLLTLQV